MPSFVGSVNRVTSPAPSSGSAFVYRGSDSSTPLNMSFPQPSTDPPSAHQKEEVFVSPMPSLDAKPDDGWANWGTDPSKIKKEEEQVKRPPAKTISNKGSAISPVTQSAVRLDLSVRAENQKNSYTLPASVAYGHRTAGTLPPAPYSAGWEDPPAVALRLPGPVHRQPYQTSSGPGQSANFRPALPAASYTFRPTFQYGKAAEDTAVSTVDTTPATNLNTADSLIFRPPQLATRPAVSSAVQSQSTESHEGMVTSLPRSRRPEASSDIKQAPLFAKAMQQLDPFPASPLSAVLPVAADSDMTTVSSTSTTANAAAPKKPKRKSKRKSVSTIPVQEIKESLELSASHTEPAKSSIGSIHVASSNSKEAADGGLMLWKSHKPLSDSIGADSGHALSSGPPSTVHASTAPSDGPKVHLPISLPAEALPETEKLDDIEQDFFTLPIPKGMTPTKAVLAIDLDALKELGANQVDIQVDLAQKQFAFKLNDSTKQARRKVRSHCQPRILCIAGGVYNKCLFSQ